MFYAKFVWHSPMNKNIVSVLILPVLFVLLATGCRKGENDPWFSLHSRKARVAGSWTVTSGCGKDTEVNPSYTITNEWSFNGSVKTVNTVTIGHDTVLSSSSDKYQLLCTFEKDGSFAIVENNGTSSAGSSTKRGTWNFADGEERRSRLILSITTWETPSGSLHYEGSNCPVVIYDIDELRNDKMVIAWEGSLTDRGATTTEKGSFVLEQK